MAKIGVDLDQDLQVLDAKIKQAKFEYEQYFMGHRPREPILTRGEAQKIIAYWSNLPIKNTAVRFRFNTLCARFFTLRRQWDDINRKIENGVYEPVNKRARRRVPGPRGEAPVPSTATDKDVCAAYLEAREACGQGGVDRARVDAMLERQRAAIMDKYGCRDVKFRVVVEAGKPRLKATPVR